MRLINQHQLRQVHDLNGLWDFVFLGDVKADKVRPSRIAYNDQMPVPGCFDATPKYAAKRGLAAYRTFVQVSDTSLHRLVLSGVHHWGRIFVDGKALRDHVGGFTRFHTDFKPRRAGTLEIVVLVDNRIDYATCPLHLDYFDWYHFGGIARGARLERLGDTWVESVRITTLATEPAVIEAAIEVGPTKLAKATLEVLVDGQLAISQTVRLKPEGTRLVRTLSSDTLKLWTPEKPNLHQMTIRLAGDDLVERFGVRTVRVEGRDILLNEKPLMLRGFNRHEVLEGFGHTQTLQHMVVDLQLLKELNVNFIRGSHYPQDEAWLDLCDEHGILMWVESIAWQATVEHLTDERFLALQEQNIDEMIAMSANHPSVIMWGLLNESASKHLAAKPGYRRLIKRIRQGDDTRPVTYACNTPKDCKCFDLVDIISINTYPGWYWSSIEGTPGELDSLVAGLDKHPHVKKKPMIISEIGAEGMFGVRDWNQDRWTEDYQAKFLKVVAEHLLIKRDRVCGLAFWLYNDFRSSEGTRRMLGRGRGFNNKGIVDEYRRRKLAFVPISEIYGKVRKAKK